jgi:hypothetical protein
VFIFLAMKRGGGGGTEKEQSSDIIVSQCMHISQSNRLLYHTYIIKNYITHDGCQWSHFELCMCLVQDS